MSEDDNMKRDLSTKELALRLHLPVEEARALKSLPGPEADLDSRASTAPELKEDPAAWYCKNRTGGVQHSIDVRGQRYCLLQRYCHCQVQNGAKAKKCAYKGR